MMIYPRVSQHAAFSHFRVDTIHSCPIPRRVLPSEQHQTPAPFLGALAHAGVASQYRRGLALA